MTKKQRAAWDRKRADRHHAVAYYRVSTKKQGESGLGLEAQQAAVTAYAAANGLTIFADYQDIESGRHNDRPQLALAISHAKLAKAKLVIAKIDRLARNVAFVATLMESKAEFVAVDNPNVNDLTIHILASVAEDEAKRIAQRTKDGLAALKARGYYSNKLGRVVTLGAPEHLSDAGKKKGRDRAAVVNRKQKAEAYEHLEPLIRKLRADGLGYHAIAKQLNESGHATRRGCPWNPVQVRRVLLPTQAAPPFRAA